MGIVFQRVKGDNLYVATFIVLLIHATIVASHACTGLRNVANHVSWSKVHFAKPIYVASYTPDQWSRVSIYGLEAVD